MKLKTIAMVAAMSALAACAADTRVLGESLDSGLGELSADYTGWEFMPAGSVRGESLDSGLGELDQTYTGAEYMPANAELVSSEDLANWRCSTCS
jgi:hypothetical protein